MKIIIPYFATLISLLAADAVWLLFVAKDFYRRQIGFLYAENINFIPAAFFYPIYALAILFFCVLPALKSGSVLEAVWRGALLGLAAYSAYDLTNHATIANWPFIMTAVDILWGVFVTALVAAAAFFIVNSLK